MDPCHAEMSSSAVRRENLRPLSKEAICKEREVMSRDSDDIFPMNGVTNFQLFVNLIGRASEHKRLSEKNAVFTKKYRISTNLF